MLGWWDAWMVGCLDSGMLGRWDELDGGMLGWWDELDGGMSWMVG